MIAPSFVNEIIVFFKLEYSLPSLGGLRCWCSRWPTRSHQLMWVDNDDVVASYILSAVVLPHSQPVDIVVKY
jgi:hypothetical protein